jgi:hypothetical protein
MKLQLVQVESRQALDFGDDDPLWYIHGLTVSGTRYVYKKLFGSEIAADIAVAIMTAGSGETVAQIFGEWERTYQRRQL